MKSWKRLLPYILINIFVSALTTLAVLWIWDAIQRNNLPESSPIAIALPEATPASTAAPLPPLDQPVIKIESIIGAGDVQTETVRLVRLGKDPVALTGWKLKNESGEVFTFPELSLLQDGAFVEVYTRTGHNTPFELYMGSSKPVWRTGETATLVDTAGYVRAQFTIP